MRQVSSPGITRKFVIAGMSSLTTLILADQLIPLATTLFGAYMGAAAAGRACMSRVLSLKDSPLADELRVVYVYCECVYSFSSVLCNVCSVCNNVCSSDSASGCVIDLFWCLCILILLFLCHSLCDCAIDCRPSQTLACLHLRHRPLHRRQHQT